MRALGGFFAMSLDTFVVMFRRRFAWREYVQQTWFVARVCTLPAMAMIIPYAVLWQFTTNVVLNEIGAADYSGVGAAIGDVSNLAPITTVLVISGAAATAICADLGARTIREEIDALRTMGVDPIQALVLPRVLATVTVTLVLDFIIVVFALIVSFVFSVYAQHISAGAFVDHLTLLTGVGDVIVSLAKATAIGLTGGLLSCYKGLTVSGGPAGVGRAVNETVVFCFLALFTLNTTITAIGAEFVVS